MAQVSQVISFRANAELVALLEQRCKKGESLNQTAQRLIKELLNPESTEVDTMSPVTSTRVDRLEGQVVELRDRLRDIEEMLRGKSTAA